jgi:predicted DNA-binding mobile mystery protein A
MTLTDLATRLGVTFQAVSRLEKSEQEGSVTISTLRAIADALDCDLTYAFVPRESLEAFLVENAREHARRRVDRVQHSMTLEAQEVSEKEIEHQIRDLTEELLAGNWRKIWKKP